MNYTAFVVVVNLMGKMAHDLARLLDDPLFSVKSDYSMPDVRQKAFDRLCSVCQSAGTALPDLETELIDCHLPSKVDPQKVTDSKALADKINLRVGKKRTPAAKICQAAATMIETFPNLTDYGSIDRKTLVALANRCLLEMRLDPIRPEYKPISVNQPTPPRHLKILIVDDSPSEILKTALSLAGWPEVEVEYIHQKLDGYDPPADKKAAAVAELANEIVGRNCDVVFMDEGLRGIQGHDVVKKVRETTQAITFVANTGGGEDELFNAGCVAGARKGEKIGETMRIVFNYLSR